MSAVEPFRGQGDVSPLPFTPTPWAADGACRGWPTALWFPTGGDNGTQGKAICATCTVRQECGDYAVAFGIHFGTFGGLSSTERAARRREQVRANLPERSPSTGSRKAAYDDTYVAELLAVLATAHANLDARTQTQENAAA